MARYSLKQQPTTRMTIGHSVVTKAFSIEDPYQLERICHDYIRLDRSIKTLELQREEKKQQILNYPGVNPDHLVEITLKYRRGRQSKIRCWLNRFKYDVEKLYERLKEKHLAAFQANVREGTAFRVAIPSTPKTRKADIDEFENYIRSKYPHAEMTAYAGSALEPIIDEVSLLSYCKEEKIPLSGTREPVYNFSVETT